MIIMCFVLRRRSNRK